MNMVVEMTGQITVVDEPGGPAEAVERDLDLVMQELVDLDAVDPSISVDLETYEVTMSVVVAAVNPIEAIQVASGELRAAIHASGGGPPDWPDAFSGAWGIRLTSVNSALVHDDRAPGNHSGGRKPSAIVAVTTPRRPR